MSGAGEWEPEAENWVRWARTPGHDAYWYYGDAFFDLIVPPAGRHTVEIGCGEGRVARDLAARGHRVTAVDTSVSLLGYARRDDQTGAYVVADSATLPLVGECADIVVAYNSLQVVGDMEGTLRETARVVERGGFLCLCGSHPVTDLGRFHGDGSDLRFMMRAQYFERSRVEDTVEEAGLTMTFTGWTYTLEDYTLALEHAGFRVETIREPRPVAAVPRFERWQQVPLFLFARAVKT